MEALTKVQGASDSDVAANDDDGPPFDWIRIITSWVALLLAILTQCLPRIMLGLSCVLVLALVGFLCFCRLLDEGLWRQAMVASWVVRPIVEYNIMSWWIFLLPHKYREAYTAQYHENWGEYPLRVCLAMRGFYVKLGQQGSFAMEEMVPGPYRRSLSVLQEDVPPLPFKTIRGIVESEMSCKMEEVFLSFDAKPIASASIGQVHFAELLDGTPVVVKVQYPDVQRFFRIDMRTTLKLVGLTSPQFKQMLREQEKNFTKEFDYIREGRNLRLMYDRINGISDTRVPQPYDSKHPMCPARFVKTGGLVSSMLLVMDRCPGKSVTKIATGFLEQFARSVGMSVKEFKTDMMDKLKDKDFLNKLMDTGKSAAMEMAAAQVYLSTGLLAWNALATTYNWTFGFFASNLNYQWTGVAFNSSSLVQRLYDVHAEQMFAVGSFNADPHVGNLMIDESTGIIYLLDFGQLIEIKKHQRILFAQTIIAMLEGDKATVHKNWKKMGNDFSWIGPGEIDETELYYAMVHSIYNGSTGLEMLMKVTGCDDIMQYVERFSLILHVERISSVCAMIHRMTDCLRGAAMTLGAGNPSAGELFRPAAERYLQSQRTLMIGK